VDIRQQLDSGDRFLVFLGDHLGSVDTITNANGVLAQRMKLGALSSRSRKL
jgi:hypothetical protein